MLCFWSEIEFVITKVQTHGTGRAQSSVKTIRLYRRPVVSDIQCNHYLDCISTIEGSQRWFNLQVVVQQHRHEVRDPECGEQHDLQQLQTLWRGRPRPGPLLGLEWPRGTVTALRLPCRPPRASAASTEMWGKQKSFTFGRNLALRLAEFSLNFD